MGQSPKIEKSSLNGTHRVTVTSSVRQPLGITLDTRNRRVFLVESVLGMTTVESFDYDGINRTLIYRRSQSLYFFSGVTIFSSYLFLIDGNNNSFCKMNSSNGAITASVLVSGIDAAIGLVPYDSSRQQPG